MPAYGRSNTWYVNGTRSGYTEFRHGSQKAEKPRRILTDRQREAMARRAAQRMSDWTFSPFEHEGPLLSGIRSGLCLQGNRWLDAHAEAAEIVGRAIASLGLERPDWYEGQPDHSNGREFCRGCHGPLDGDARAARRMFCSTECATIVVRNRNRKIGEASNLVFQSAERMITRAKAPPRPCTYCDTPFHSDLAEARFCSKRCATLWQHGENVIKDKPCPCCGALFKPRKGAIYCSSSCAAVVRVEEERRRLGEESRTCRECRADFTPLHRDAVYCSTQCSARSRARAKRREEGRGEYHFACATCDSGFVSRLPSAQFCSPVCKETAGKIKRGKVRLITPKVFDYLMKSQGSRLTDTLFAEAA